MDDPIADIDQVIHNLTEGDSTVQQQTLEKYFTHDASFYHPFCSVNGNRTAILRIFQWYKILSPHIELEIESVAYDEHNLILYVTIHQIFAIWFVPFHRSPVTLTTKLQLVRGQDLNVAAPKANSSKLKYYIASQNDLYQVDQFVRFFAPWGLGTSVIALWHWFATLLCIFGALLLQPLQSLFVGLSRPITGPSSSRANHKIKSRSNHDDVLRRMNNAERVPQRKEEMESGFKNSSNSDDVLRRMNNAARVPSRQ